MNLSKAIGHNNDNYKYLFICCVEAGRLEYQTCLMISTFRKNAGEILKNSPLYVVSGRSGSRLSNQTMEFFLKNNVHYVKAHKNNPKSWFNYSNKVAAVSWAQENLKSEYIAWLDSDILIAGDFIDDLSGDFDFAGRCETHAPVVAYGDEKYISYWKRICDLAHCSFDQIPWMNIENIDSKLKLYFNSGFFIWKRSSVFAEKYREVFVNLLNSRYATSDGAAWFADQVIISPIVIANRLKWRHISLRNHHMVFSGHIDGQDPSPDMENSNLIHYSKSLTGDCKSRMMARLKVELPEIHDQVLNFERNFTMPNGLLNKLNLISILRRFRQMIFMKTVMKV